MQVICELYFAKLQPRLDVCFARYCPSPILDRQCLIFGFKDDHGL